ncbi:MAG: hypothetical protein HY923_04605 [Elusimicrobia bacterium]|nr:hypothetical protein [Elusimicrobiota bacterium]
MIALTGLAKTRVDAGFSRVGRKLSPNDPADRALMIMAARAIAQANAVMALSERGLANEALPILRGLAEICLMMRWVSEKDSTSRAVAALSELQDPDWETHWPSVRLRERGEAYDVPAAAIEAVLGSVADFARGSAQGLPWGHVFAEATRPGRKAEEVLPAAAVFLGHALKALDSRWPGEFPGAEEMWSGAKISRG